MTLDCEVVITRSGAPAMRDRTTGEVMHPVIGPRTEAQQLYVGPSNLEARLRDASTSAPLVLYDVGLGAGSNAVAAFALSESLGALRRPLHITSFDRSPAALRLALDPAHARDFALDGAVGDAARALLASGSHRGPHTSWRLCLGDVLTCLPDEPSASAHVVFWDPFSPKVNPDLWSLAAFTTLRRVCADDATVHTYGGATACRAALLLAGFFVGLGEVIGAGRQGTVAATRLADLRHPLDARWLDRLARSSAPFPPDAPRDALDRIRSHPQFAGALPTRRRG